mmetsp:Transcript_42361/g.61883  ORF Transcript_42361/g.61883 Transcript_42361/m.61883 type:complete len:234 (-) Transcript_42361:1548-2249(-)
MVYFPGSAMCISMASCFAIVYPRMLTVSGTSAPSGISSKTQPLFSTTNPSTFTSQSWPARITSAPSSFRFFTLRPSPSRTSDDLSVMLPPSTLSSISCLVIAKPGQMIMRGPGVTGIPAILTRSFSPLILRSIPAYFSLRWFCIYLSDSADDIVPGAVFPPSTASTPDSREFFAGLKVNHRSNMVNPIFASLPSSFWNNLGISCIIHSSLVGFLKSVLVSSLYFGFTNSTTTP